MMVKQKIRICLQVFVELLGISLLVVEERSKMGLTILINNETLNFRSFQTRFSKYERIFSSENAEKEIVYRCYYLNSKTFKTFSKHQNFLFIIKSMHNFSLNFIKPLFFFFLFSRLYSNRLILCNVHECKEVNMAGVFSSELSN